MSPTWFFASCVIGGIAQAAIGEIVSMDSKSVIFDAGRSTPTPGLGGILPPFLTLGTGTGRYIEFSSVTGAVGFGVSDPPTPPTGPDGYAYPSGMDITSLNGISGMRGPRYAFLAGVFLTDAVPTDPAPARLDFGITGFEFASISPALQQSFFVGDGLTGTGIGGVQRFYVPDGATRLYLGILDAGGVVGAPGMYGDNFGSYSATIVVLPAASTSTIALALGAVTSRRRRPTVEVNAKLTIGPYT